MVVNIQVVRQTHKQRSEELTSEYERTKYPVYPRRQGRSIYTRRQRYENSTFGWPNISLVRTNFMISKPSWYSAPDTMGHFSKAEFNLTNALLHKSQLFIGSLERSCRDVSETTLSFEKITFWWSYSINKYRAPEDPIYLYLTIWSDVHTYDVIKRRTYTSSYT